MTTVTVASGKGGTGKTTLATSLAVSLADEASNTVPLLFLDCDVEAPNAHLFLKPVFEESQPVNILIPEVDESLCTHCGICAQVCAYHAIAVLSTKTLVFPQLCHGCGSCTAQCPEKAITEVPISIGVVERGWVGEGLYFGRGVLDVGEPMAVPVIRQLRKWMPPQVNQTIIIDSSPGTSCPVVASLTGSDYAILVTEPTPFGLHDLKLAVQVTQELNIPAGVVINRNNDNDPYAEMESYLQENDLPVLLRIPFDRSIAEGVAQGKTLVEIYPDYKHKLRQMYAELSTQLNKNPA